MLLHKDKKAILGVLTHMTSRSPMMMSELSKLFLLIDESDIKTRTYYITSAANTWADKVSG